MDYIRGILQQRIRDHSITRGRRGGVFLTADKLFISTRLGGALKISNIITCLYTIKLKYIIYFIHNLPGNIYSKNTSAAPPRPLGDWMVPPFPLSTTLALNHTNSGSAFVGLAEFINNYCGHYTVIKSTAFNSCRSPNYIIKNTQGGGGPNFLEKYTWPTVKGRTMEFIYTVWEHNLSRENFAAICEMLRNQEAPIWIRLISSFWNTNPILLCNASFSTKSMPQLY